jgi:cytochrome c553
VLAHRATSNRPSIRGAQLATDKIPHSGSVVTLAELRASGLKRCFACKMAKPTSQFSKDKSRSDGLQPKCKACYSVYKASRAGPKRPRLTDQEKVESRKRTLAAYRERNRATERKRSRDWLARNKESFAIYAKAWREANKLRLVELRRLWTEQNRELLARQAKEYADRNKGRIAAHARARQAQKLLATPAWADKKAIEAFYVEAARLTALTGIPHHVDHIYPLRSKIMCGLHVETNLQILPATDNIKKGNRVPLSREIGMLP